MTIVEQTVIELLNGILGVRGLMGVTTKENLNTELYSSNITKYV